MENYDSCFECIVFLRIAEVKVSCWVKNAV